MGRDFVLIGGADPQRVPCAPTSFSNIGKDHKHLCACGACWSHSNENLGDVHAHTCPNCGSEVWHKHWNDVELAVKERLEREAA